MAKNEESAKKSSTKNPSPHSEVGGLLASIEREYPDCI